MESRSVKVVHGGCVVAKANFEAFKAVAEGLHIPVKVLRQSKAAVVVDMEVKDYALVEATLKRITDRVKL